MKWMFEEALDGARKSPWNEMKYTPDGHRIPKAHRKTVEAYLAQRERRLKRKNRTRRPVAPMFAAAALASSGIDSKDLEIFDALFATKPGSPESFKILDEVAASLKPTPQQIGDEILGPGVGLTIELPPLPKTDSSHGLQDRGGIAGPGLEL